MYHLAALVFCLLVVPQTFAITRDSRAPATDYIPPEHATSLTEKPLVYGAHHFVVTNNPWASAAAHNVLTQGGNATDAAIAAALVLGLTEPQSSGLGGGGYALTFQAQTQQLIAYDGRESAPQSATATLFLDSKGQPLPFDVARHSAKAVGVPGEVALLHRLHVRAGKRPWASLVQPALRLANQGFPMSPRLYHLLAANQRTLQSIPAVKALYFTPNGQVKAIGTRIINRAYARTLQRIARNPREFYTGPIAKHFIQTVNDAAGKPLYQPADLSDYRVRESKALCHSFRQWFVCSTPFASGGVSTLELLALYAEQNPIPNKQSVDWVYRFLEASQLTFADRNTYLADPSQMRIQAQSLLDVDYLRSRSQLIQEHAMQTPVAAGIPRGSHFKQAADAQNRRHGTTSLVVVDTAGNGVTMTLSVEHEFGSQLFVDGFFLNNELTDFSFQPSNTAGHPVANQVKPGSRPRSAISPVMVFDRQHQLTLLTGSPGGAVIICYVAKNLIQLLDFDQDPQQSAASGNLCAMNSDPLIEQGSDLMRFIPKLTQRGQHIRTTELVSGIVTIQRAPNQPGWRGAADPRREGQAIGG